MPTYIMLSRLSPDGVQTIKNNPSRIKEVNREVEQLGATVKAQWATLGQFDFVNVGRDGREHAWGTVLEWDPPRRLRYLWHLFFAPEEATEIEVTFTASPAGTTVALTQTGWDALGPAGPPRRERTGQVWRTIAAAFSAAAR